MSSDQNARLGAILRGDESTPAARQLPAVERTKHHVLSRNMQSRAGRLYFNEELDVEIPSLEIYAAR